MKTLWMSLPLYNVGLVISIRLVPFCLLSDRKSFTLGTLSNISNGMDLQCGLLTKALFRSRAVAFRAVKY